MTFQAWVSWKQLVARVHQTTERTIKAESGNRAGLIWKKKKKSVAEQWLCRADVVWREIKGLSCDTDVGSALWRYEGHECASGPSVFSTSRANGRRTLSESSSDSSSRWVIRVGARTFPVEGEEGKHSLLQHEHKCTEPHILTPTFLWLFLLP